MIIKVRIDNVFLFEGFPLLLLNNYSPIKFKPAPGFLKLLKLVCVMCVFPSLSVLAYLASNPDKCNNQVVKI